MPRPPLRTDLGWYQAWDHPTESLPFRYNAACYALAVGRTEHRGERLRGIVDEIG